MKKVTIFLMMMTIMIIMAITTSCDTFNNEPNAECSRLIRNEEFKEALVECKKQADAGVAKSIHNMAVIHYYGLGVFQDYDLAYKYATESMNLGVAGSAY